MGLDMMMYKADRKGKAAPEHPGDNASDQLMEAYYKESDKFYDELEEVA